MTLDTSTIPEVNLLKATLGGQAFIAATGQVTAGANITMGLALFNPSNSGKNVLISSIRFSNSGGSSMLNIYTITSDPAYANPLQIANSKIGGAASAIASHITYQNANTSVVGTFMDVGELPQATHTALPSTISSRAPQRGLPRSNGWNTRLMSSFVSRAQYLGAILAIVHWMIGDITIVTQ